MPSRANYSSLSCHPTQHYLRNSPISKYLLEVRANEEARSVLLYNQFIWRRGDAFHESPFGGALPHKCSLDWVDAPSPHRLLKVFTHKRIGQTRVLTENHWYPSRPRCINKRPNVLEDLRVVESVGCDTPLHIPNY